MPNDTRTQLITSMANAVREKAATHDSLEDIAAEAATATGLRRAVWATLTEREKAEAIKAAVERGKNGA
jgi:serine protease inhibitor ecotin